MEKSANLVWYSPDIGSSITKILNIFFIRMQSNERPLILHAIRMLEVIVLSSHPEKVKNVNLISPGKGLFMQEIMLQRWLGSVVKQQTACN